MEMQVLLVLIVAGVVAGWLVGQMVKGGLGMVGNIVVGAVGALIVGWGLPKMGVALPALGDSWILNAVVYGAVGGAVLTLIVCMVKRPA
jgi:uncharacterized membrane protein YeaQ/YmgE (transglycosylase-associated protein family)